MWEKEPQNEIQDAPKLHTHTYIYNTTCKLTENMNVMLNESYMDAGNSKIESKYKSHMSN